jgi:hypothetical protein
MSTKKHIYGGLITSVFIGLTFAINAFANTVTIGPEGGTITVESQQVSGVRCSEGTFNYNGNTYAMKCDIETSSATRSLYYTSSWVNSGNSAAQQERALIQKINNAGGNTNGGGTAGGGTGGTSSNSSAANGVPVNSECTSILPPDWCDPGSTTGIVGILNLVLNIMTVGMGILATIGIVISGIQWLTARDKEDQVVKAKSRIFNIVIGLLLWGIMWLVLSWLMPGGINLDLTP